MDLFTVLEYDFPLKFNQFIEYLENTNIKYKIKNNIIAFTIKKIMNGFAIYDEDNIKYIIIKFVSLKWSDKNKIVEDLNEKYNLISHSLETNTRIYEKYSIVFKYSTIQSLEAVFFPLNSVEEELKKKISKKMESYNDLECGILFLDVAVQFILSILK